MKKRGNQVSVRMTKAQLWGVIQMAEASYQGEENLSRAELTGLERLRRAHHEWCLRDGTIKRKKEKDLI